MMEIHCYCLTLSCHQHNYTYLQSVIFLITTSPVITSNHPYPLTPSLSSVWPIHIFNQSSFRLPPPLVIPSLSSLLTIHIFSLLPCHQLQPSISQSVIATNTLHPLLSSCLTIHIFPSHCSYINLLLRLQPLIKFCIAIYMSSLSPPVPIVHDISSAYTQRDCLMYIAT